MDTNIFVVLIGDNTRYLSKLVKWEIEAALYVGLPIIGVNLNKNKRIDNLCRPVLRNALAVFIPYEKRIIKYALESWPESHYQLSRKGKNGPHFYGDSVYNKLPKE
jgi:hypothetical protein